MRSGSVVMMSRHSWIESDWRARKGYSANFKRIHSFAFIQKLAHIQELVKVSRINNILV